MNRHHEQCLLLLCGVAQEGVAYSDDEDDSDDDFNAGAESLSDNDSDYDARWGTAARLAAGYTSNEALHRC